MLSGYDLQVTCLHAHVYSHHSSRPCMILAAGAITPELWSVCGRTWKVLAVIQGRPQIALKHPFFDTASPQFRVFLVLLYALSPLFSNLPALLYPHLKASLASILQAKDTLGVLTAWICVHMPLGPSLPPSSLLSLSFLLGPLTAVSVIALCLHLWPSAICRHQMRANSKQE